MLSADDYLNSPDYNTTEVASLPFYQRLAPIVFQNTVPLSVVSYHNSYNLWDYANYQYIHNHTIADKLMASDLELLRNYASQQEFARNGNLSADGLTPGDEIRTIAGQTYAGAVLSLLGQVVRFRGRNLKLSMLFGEHQVFLAFFALSGLYQRSDTFKSIPEPGSMMAFELFSSNNANATDFPSQKDLWVRFLFRNGTDPSSQLLSYPLFGRGNSATDMKWFDFIQLIENIAIGDIATWCLTCGSLAMYCPQFVDNRSNDTNSNNGNFSPSGHSSISPTVAGVLGAVVTIAAFVLVTVAAIFLGGLRCYRRDSKRQSSLGGFKGAEKLASDTDLTVAAAKGGAGATVIRHERVGSWELGDAKKNALDKGLDEGEGGSESRTTSGSIDRVVSMADYSSKHDDDAISITNPYGEPVKTDERV